MATKSATKTVNAATIRSTDAKVVLTGFMGTGKSRVGRLVAARMGWPFADSDHEIVARTGKPIARIFSEHGEPHFRALERVAIAAIAAAPGPAVIATGGGALVDETNCRVLKAAGLVVCLRARPEIIASRLNKSAEPRPKLLEGGKPIAERIAELHLERAAAYARAEIEIDTSDLTAEQAADAVIAAFDRWCAENRCAPSA